MIPSGVEYVIITPVWVSTHASMVSLLSFAFLAVSVINIEKRDFMSFYFPMIAGVGVLASAYPVFESFSYALTGWFLIALLLFIYRMYLMKVSE